MALGLAFNIKYLPIVFLPYLLLRRRWTAAGTFAASVVGFALLPAVLTGWDTNLHYQAVAYSGLFRLMGVPVGAARAANIDGITAEFSVSIPSGIARLAGAGGSAVVALAAAGVLALASAAVAAWMYSAERRGVPVPAGRIASRRSTHPRHRRSGMGGTRDGRAGVQPADQHAPSLPAAPGADARRLAAAVAAAGALRWPLFVGAALLALGLIFPPGTQDFAEQVGVWCAGSLEVWRTIGGPCWCAWPCSAR